MPQGALAHQRRCRCGSRVYFNRVFVFPKVALYSVVAAVGPARQDEVRLKRRRPTPPAGRVELLKRKHLQERRRALA